MSVILCEFFEYEVNNVGENYDIESVHREITATTNSFITLRFTTSSNQTQHLNFHNENFLNGIQKLF